jgi:cytochrome b involved in lipid metabolism
LTTKEEIRLAVKKARTNFKLNKRLSEVTLKRSEKLASETFTKDIKVCNMDNIINSMEKEAENAFKDNKNRTPTPTPIPTPTPTPTPTTPSYTIQDVQTHSVKTNCWTAINGNVYNLTSAFGQHP